MGVRANNEGLALESSPNLLNKNRTLIHHFNVSGKYRDGDENHLEKPPFAVCRDFAAAVEQICTML